MKVPQLFTELIKDCEQKCAISAQKRDLMTIENRLRNEGWSFVTITLPDFLDDFTVALENGVVSPDLFHGWKKRLCLPAFMQGFTSLIFEHSTGRLLDDPNVVAIACVRQILSFYKKVKALCSDARMAKAYSDYESIERRMDFLIDEIPSKEYREFHSVARILWSRVFGDDDLILSDLLPYHGPGSTAEGIIGNKKYVPNYAWPEEANAFFNSGEVLYSSEECMFADESFSGQGRLVKKRELAVRVISVPKTMKKSRVIAMEPVSMQMLQQSVKDFIIEKLEGTWPTSGRINFSDQTKNQRLAFEASKRRHLATIDLSAASDRVHKDLIWDMLSVNPLLRDLCFVTRTEFADLPNHGRQFLNKFASMGSALCFPIEAMFFYTLCVYGLLKHGNLEISASNIYKNARECYVYGDDILIPNDAFATVCETLTVFGNVPGLAKSFHKGRFRESCGMDAYDGKDITPIYQRRHMPNSKGDAQSIISSVETARQLFKKGYWRAAKCIKTSIEQLVGILPTTIDDAEGIGWNFGEQRAKTRYNSKLQRLEVLTLKPNIQVRKDRISGYHALTKCLLKLERGRKPRDRFAHDLRTALQDEFERTNPRHLSETPRRDALTLKRHWISADALIGA